MNYLFYCEKPIPKYMKTTLNCVLSVDKDAKIYICTNEQINYKNIETLNLNEIASESTKSIIKSNLEDKSSIARVFYLNDAQEQLNIKNFVHFDNNVLLYKPFNLIDKIFKKNKLNITKPSNSKIKFGYSYIESFEVLSQLKHKINETINYGTSNKWSFNYGVPFKEDDYLGKIYNDNQKLFNILPILPHENDVVFDPSSYGHFLDGTKSHPRKKFRKGYINPDHYIGREVVAKRVSIQFSNNNPLVIWENQKFEIVNIHLYSERFKKFLPKNYKEYI